MKQLEDTKGLGQTDRERERKWNYKFTNHFYKICLHQIFPEPLQECHSRAWEVVGQFMNDKLRIFSGRVLDSENTIMPASRSWLREVAVEVGETILSLTHWKVFWIRIVFIFCSMDSRKGHQWFNRRSLRCSGDECSSHWNHPGWIQELHAHLHHQLFVGLSKQFPRPACLPKQSWPARGKDWHYC